MLLLVVFALLASQSLTHINAKMDYEKFATIATAPAASVYMPTALASIKYEQQQQVQPQQNEGQLSWPPTATHANWFILQTTAADNSAAAESVALTTNSRTSSANPAEHQLMSISPVVSSLKNYAARGRKHQDKQQQTLLQHQQQQQQQPQQYPPPHQADIYYAYASVDNGNFHLSAKDTRNNRQPPYLLTISNQQSHELKALGAKTNGNSQNESMLIHQWLSSNDKDKIVENHQTHQAQYINAGNGNSNNNNNSNSNIDSNNKNSNSNSKNNHNNKFQQYKRNNSRNSVAESQFQSQTQAQTQSKQQSTQISPLLVAWQDIGKNTDNHSTDVNTVKSNKAYIDKSLQNAGGGNARDTIITDVVNERYNDVLTPLGNLLDKVRYFCDVMKEIISEDDKDKKTSGSGELVPVNNHETLPHTASALNTAKATEDSGELMVKVHSQGQGQSLQAAINFAAVENLSSKQSSTLGNTSSMKPTKQTTTATLTKATKLIRTAASTTPPPLPPATINKQMLTAKSLTSSAALFIGRGKKLKKKLKKFMLPLLLAYKLKFIALLPLLIGGLTLLVGSTGLAGFFFALFVTVMSLKMHSGHEHTKSIVIGK